jgi:hypothetical protein
MNYQIRGLEPALFEQFFDLDDVTLAGRGMRRVRSDQPVGYPCRISLEDAPVGEELLLLPFAHQDGATLFSVRAYDGADDMVDAEVVDGREAAPLIERYLARPDVAYLHLHFARRGCFACRVDRI